MTIQFLNFSFAQTFTHWFVFAPLSSYCRKSKLCKVTCSLIYEETQPLDSCCYLNCGVLHKCYRDNLIWQSNCLSIINMLLLLNFKLTLSLNLLVSFLLRIYVVHDEVKDKNFELELSWIGEGLLILVDLADWVWSVNKFHQFSSLKLVSACGLTFDIKVNTTKNFTSVK